MLRVTTEQIEQAMQAIKDGKIVVFPTETSYGIGCDATNEEAVERIFQIKGRQAGKALPVIIPSRQSASEYVVMTSAAKALADKFWPGPLNIIANVHPSSKIAEACSKDGTQSVRVSSHPFTSILVKRLGRPIVATSANVAGQDAIYSIEEVREVFKDQADQPDVIIDGGELPNLPSSTTVKTVGDDKVEIIRAGSIKIPAEFLV